MDTMTTGQVAARLGTSVPRVHRAVKRLGLRPARSPGGHLKLGATDVRRLTTALGWVPEIADLNREGTLALAALGRRPFGLTSARAVARAAGISPTAASGALQHLEASGYVEQVFRQVVEGHVRTISVWQVRWTSAVWRAAAPELAPVVLPETNRDAPIPRHLPNRFSHLFWDVPTPTKIDLEASGPTVAHRVLTSNDPQAIAWAASALRPADLRSGAQFRGTDSRTRALAENLAQ